MSNKEMATCEGNRIRALGDSANFSKARDEVRRKATNLPICNWAQSNSNRALYSHLLSAPRLPNASARRSITTSNILQGDALYNFAFDKSCFPDQVWHNCFAMFTLYVTFGKMLMMVVKLVTSDISNQNHTNSFILFQMVQIMLSGNALCDVNQ